MVCLLLTFYHLTFALQRQMNIKNKSCAKQGKTCSLSLLITFMCAYWFLWENLWHLLRCQTFFISWLCTPQPFRKVILWINMLCTSMINWVLHQINAILIIKSLYVLPCSLYVLKFLLGLVACIIWLLESFYS